MRFNCGPTWKEKREHLESWHKWFAWHPVRVGSHDCRWLEWVERKGRDYWVETGHTWDYRPLERVETE